MAGRAATFLATIALLSLLGISAAQSEPLAAPGELVDVGGHSLHILCIGEGSPTVVLETGLGDASINFRSLQTRLASYTRTCAYDRAGYGWSESGPEPRDLQTVASELGTLLHGAGENGPYVLAGHSIGGLYALGFAAQNRDDVVGVVLIDSSHPRQLEELRAVPEVIDVQDMEIQGLAGIVAMAEDGSLPPELVRPNAPPVLRADLQDQWAKLFVQAKQLRAAVAEYDAIDATMGQAAESLDLGDIPLIVLSRGVGLEGQLPGDQLAGPAAGDHRRQRDAYPTRSAPACARLGADPPRPEFQRSQRSPHASQLRPPPPRISLASPASAPESCRRTRRCREWSARRTRG